VQFAASLQRLLVILSEAKDITQLSHNRKRSFTTFRRTRRRRRRTEWGSFAINEAFTAIKKEPMDSALWFF